MFVQEQPHTQMLLAPFILAFLKTATDECTLQGAWQWHGVCDMEGKRCFRPNQVLKTQSALSHHKVSWTALSSGKKQQQRSRKVKAEATFRGTQPAVTPRWPVSWSARAKWNNTAVREYRDFISFANDNLTPAHEPVATMPNLAWKYCTETWSDPQTEWQTDGG